MLKILLLLFHISLRVTLPSDGTFSFLATKWIFNNNPSFPPIKTVYVDQDLTISCETNDPDAQVTLYRKSSSRSPAVPASDIFKDRFNVVGQSFYISKLLPEDSGTFICKGKNNNSEIELLLGSLRVLLKIVPIEPEIFPKLESDTIAIEFGGDKNITCKAAGARGISESYLNWYKEKPDGTRSLVDKKNVLRQEETNPVYIDIEILMFKNFQFADFGKYVCVRKEPNSNATFKFVNIVLEPRAAPTITFPYLNTTFIEVNVGENSLQVTCEVKGSPKPMKRWEKDGQTILTCNDDSYYCHLYFAYIAYPQHDGEYTCIAENIVDKASKSVTIQVLVPIVIKKPATLFVASFNDDKELQCEILQGNPLPIIEWQFQPNICDLDSDCSTIEEEWINLMEQVPDKTTPTNFSYVISKKSTTSMFYRCVAKNAASTDSYQMSLLRSENAPPEFILSGTNLINEKDRMYLKCEAALYVYVSIKIQKGNKLLTAKLSVNSKTTVLEYEILSANKADAGLYKCFATLKRGGEKIKEYYVTVKELMKPSIGSFNNLTISQDKTANIILMCNSSGNPPPLISWNHNHIPLIEIPLLSSIDSCNYTNPGFYKHIEVTSWLILCKIHYKKHQGSFECNASNTVGFVTKTMNLTILAKPRIFEWKHEITMFATTSSELKCVSQANPPANVTWFKWNANKTQYLSSQMGTNQYFISNVNSRDSGTYKCTAINKLGSSESIVRVTVKDSAAVYSGTIKKDTLVAVLVPAIIILLVALIAIFLYRRHLKNKYARYLAPDKEFVIDPDRTIFEQSSELPYDMAWEFPRERLTFIKALGSGAFGQVWLAEAEGIHNFRPRDNSLNAVKLRRQLRKQTKRYHSLSIRYKKQHEICNAELEKTMVAVKTLKDGASESEYKDLASELKILIHLGEHKNIVNLLGACTTKGEKLHVILECCPGGDLLNFLRSKKTIFQPVWFKKETDMENEFTYIDMVMIAYQVAQGMDFLQSRKCVHRDLAARNILIGIDFVMKVADFGLARDIYKNEVYMKDSQGLVPVKWMAPESLFDKIYTSSSDVWSYGVLLWEIFSLGASPYPGLPLEELFAFLEDGHRMGCPEFCPESVYEIMLNCWRKSPYDRPLFLHIAECLSNVLRQNVSKGSDYLTLEDERPNNDYLLANEFPRKEGSSPDNDEDEADLALVKTPLISGPGYHPKEQYNTVL